MRSARGGNWVTGVSGSNQGNGSNKRQIKYLNDDQEAKVTNIDLISPSVIERLAGGVNQR